MTQLDTLAVTQALSDGALAKLRAAFREVHYHPGGESLPPAARGAAMVFASYRGLPPDAALADLPNLRHIQLPTSGADMAFNFSAAVRELRARAEAAAAAPAANGNSAANGAAGRLQGADGADGAPVAPGEITLSTASGVHVISIPNYVVGMTIALWHQFQVMVMTARTHKKWMRNEFDLRGETYYSRNIYGRTAGLLGYGSLGRESARLLKAHGMRIVAANTTGKSTSETEYVLPGTGDPDGSIPERFYSTRDAAQLDAFLRECDVLVCSLPSTPATRGMLDADKLALLRPDALFINVGRGDIISSDAILTALNREGNLFGAALDVTDPEPLPDGHALWSHPRCIVTPHISGNTEGEYEIATDIAIANAQRIRQGLRPYNVVDVLKGY